MASDARLPLALDQVNRAGESAGEIDDRSSIVRL